MAKPNNIVLTGFMGTGKTTVGKALAAILGWRYIDTDELIEQKTGLSIPAIFQQQGEPFFRDVESEVITETMQNTQQVISTGGGIVIREQNIKSIKSNGIMVCLAATPEVIFERIKSDTNRPLLHVENPKQQIQELLKVRAPYYAKADITIITTSLMPEEIAHRIIEMIKTI
ncbi:MAG: shikimate kinase [bacterium]